MFLRLIRSYRSAEITDPFLTVNTGGNANSNQKESCVNLMNFPDEQTTFFFIKKTDWQSYKKVLSGKLGTQPPGSELCIECLVG